MINAYHLFKTLFGLTHWVADGTFTYRPVEPKFQQLYIIFGQVRGESVPAVQALLPDRKIGNIYAAFPAS